MNELERPVGALGTKGAGGAKALTPEVLVGARGREIVVEVEVLRGAKKRLAIEPEGAIVGAFIDEGTAVANGDLIADGACNAGCTGVNFESVGVTGALGATTTVLVTVVVVVALGAVGAVGADTFVVVVVVFEPPVGAAGTDAPKYALTSAPNVAPPKSEPKSAPF